MLVVLDTNVLISALWTPNGKAAYILAQTLAGILTVCYDSRMLDEYKDVLARPKFHFSTWQINALLDVIITDGMCVIPPPILDLSFIDDDDRAFFETAKYCNAPLVTGNVRHFPEDECILTVADFYQRLLKL